MMSSRSACRPQWRCAARPACERPDLVV